MAWSVKSRLSRYPPVTAEQLNKFNGAHITDDSPSSTLNSLPGLFAHRLHRPPAFYMLTFSASLAHRCNTSFF